MNADGTRERKVLVVDDDELTATQLSYLLTQAVPCSCDFAVGASGIAGRPCPEYDVVVTDLRMPGRDGLALLAELKALTPGCEVIIFTGYATLQTAVAAMKLGAADYLPSTDADVSIDCLVRAIRRVIRMCPSARAPGFHRENLIQFFLEQTAIGEERTEGSSMGSLPPGLALEYAVKLLLESCPGFQTTWHRVRATAEEHDVVCLNAAEHPFWRRQGPIILVECKDGRKEPIGADARSRFEEKIRCRQGQSTVGIFVSCAGFTRTFLSSSAKTPVPGGPPPVIVTIDGEGLAAWRGSFDRLSWLTDRALGNVLRTQLL